MPAKSISDLSGMNGYLESSHKIQLTPHTADNNEEVHIYLYNRMCALEQRINKLQTILEEQCKHCEYRKIAENIKTILS